MTTRVFPPTTSNKSTTTFGRIHDGSVSTYLDVPDSDAQMLQANDWTVVAPVGTSSTRPTTPTQGAQYLDTTLGYIITFDGLTWRKPSDGTAA